LNLFSPRPFWERGESNPPPLRTPLGEKVVPNLKRYRMRRLLMRKRNCEERY
jgi:hypothetical protein